MNSKRFGIAAVCSFALGMSLLVQPPGWAQPSYYALIRGLADGTAQIDKWHWETGDKSWINGHFFSVKSPGMPVILMPVYEALDLAGFPAVSKSAGHSFRANQSKPARGAKADLSNFGGSIAIRTKARISLIDSKMMVWALTLFGSLLPALAVLLLVRRQADRWEPGTGAAASLALGMGTVLMPFSGLFFSHILATFLLFAGFCVVMRERQRRESLGLVAAGGLLAGLAVFTEYPLAFGGAVVGIYAAARLDAYQSVARTVIRRGSAYAAGVLAGVMPVALYNLWAFGSVTTMSYQDTVAVQGKTGHDVVGLVNDGLFGIELPDPQGLVSLLLSPRGLVSLTPLLVLAAAGVIIMYRRGLKAEALTILGVFLVYWVYVAGYIWPFGGAVPGPRYLIPLLPFLGLGLPFAFKRFPSTTMVMSIVGGVVMVAATLTVSTILPDEMGMWWTHLEKGVFTRTVFTAMGFGNGWPTVVPSLCLFAAAPVLAAIGSRGLNMARDRRMALAALAIWTPLVWLVAPRVFELRRHREVPKMSELPHSLIAIGLLISVLALAVGLLAERRSPFGSQPRL